MKPTLRILIFILVVTLLPAIAIGQQDNDWGFDLAPLYFWAISIDGDTGIRGQTARTEIDFSDIWDNLEGVFTLRLIAEYRQKFGLLLDYNYLDLGKETQEGAVDLDVGFKSQILNLAGTYRIWDGRHTLDGVAGIRYTSLELDVNLRTLGARLNGDQDWVDPIVGARYSYQMTDRWTLRLYGDIGGFGAGSDFTWQGLGLIDFQPWKNVAIVAGYRGIGTDYESGSGADKFTYDAVVHGPLIGLDIRF